MDSANQSLQQIVGDLSDQAETSEEELLERILELYFQADGTRSESDTQAFGVVLAQLAYKAGMERRADLANQLALTKQAPTYLMRRLAFDNIIVARPVLQYSNRLSDSDLVTLASKLGQDHLHAIAHRLRLNPPVTDVLIDRGGSPVLVTMTQNSGSEFSPEGLVTLEERAGIDPDLNFALGLRPDLSPGLFRRFSNFINDQLLIEIGRGKPEADREAALPEEAEQPDDPAKNAAPDPDKNNDASAVEDDDSTLKVNVPDEEPEPVWKGPAHEKALVEVAKDGQVDKTVACLTKLTGLEAKLAKHCLLVAELSALMVLCKANDFANATFGALMQLREANSSGESIDTVSMLKRYDAMKTHTAKRIIQYADKKSGR